MKDFRGEEVRIGDKVAFVIAGSHKHLKEGTVSKLTPQQVTVSYETLYNRPDGSTYIYTRVVNREPCFFVVLAHAEGSEKVGLDKE